MTLTSLRPASADRSPADHDPRLAALLGDLGELDLHGRVLTEWITGEPDVRVRVWHDEAEAAVELLWCAADAPLPPHLDAVRIIGAERQVWRSPNSRGQTVDAVRFLYALLLLGEDVLTERYRLLG